MGHTTSHVFISKCITTKKQAAADRNYKWQFAIADCQTYTSKVSIALFNPLTPNDLYKCRTAQLTSRRCILYIYSTNIRTEYFKHAA